ncbi:MAG: PAS domain S-box protein [Leptolyngbyaceae cyanobacterium SM1_3_5]|nr:PAS domain S-box protein [Leptolyngbyaceae cyanobacterium SM1_3_5]
MLLNQLKVQPKNLFESFGKLFGSTQVRKLAEEYERTILSLFEHPLLATALIDFNGNLIQSNRRFCDLLGANSHAEAQAEVDRLSNQILDQNLRQTLVGGEANFYFTEKQLTNKDHEIIWVKLSASLVRLPTQAIAHRKCFAVLLEDITENKKIYSALVRAEEKWKSFVLNTPNLFIQISSSGQIIYSSPSVKHILGYPDEELLDAYIWKFIHIDDVHRFELALRLWQSNSEHNNVGIECRFKAKSNLWMCLYLQGQQFPISAEANGLIIDGYNITDRKILEAQLQDTEKKFNSLILNIPGAIFQCDLDYMMISVNSEIENITGYSSSNLICNRVRSYLSIVHPDDRSHVKNSVMQLQSGHHSTSIEYRIIHANGDIRWVCERKQKVFSASGQGVWFDGVLFDISDRKRTEENLWRSEAINRAMFRVLPEWLAQI